MTPSKAAVKFVAGYPTAITMTAKQTVPFVGVAYIQVDADASVFQSPIGLTPNADGTFGVTVQPLTTLPVGHYTGDVTVNVCADPNCTIPLAGAPFKVPYDVTALSPDGGVTTYNLPALSALPGASDWGTFQGNAGHTGFVPVTLQASAFNARWKWDAPAYSGVQWTPSPLTTGAGKFYFSTGPFWSGFATGHELFAFKEDDGSKVWSHSFSDLTYPSANPPAFAGGKVFIAAGSQSSTYMFEFDAASGALGFQSPMSSQWERYFAPTIFGGAVYSDGGTYGGMYAFDTTTGAQKFFANALQFDSWTPAVDASHAYAYMGGALRIYDSQTGTFSLDIADPNAAGMGYTGAASPVLGAANTVYANNMGTSSIACFDTLNNVVRWSVHGMFAGNPAYASGTLFAADNVPFRLEAYDEADGSLRWSWTPPVDDGQFVSDVLVTNNLVFVSTGANTYAIDLATHLPVWSYAASGSLSLSANGVLYIKDAHSIVAINLH